MTLTVLWNRVHRRHVAWATAAVIVSILLHLVLISFFPSFRIIEPPRDLTEQRYGPIKVQDVNVEPSRLEPDQRPARFHPGAKGAETPGDGGAAEAMSFRRTTDEAKVEPRPVGGGVLVGEQRSLVEPEAAEAPKWEPRQEIVRIQEKVAHDEVRSLPRRFTPSISRVSGGADIVGPADRSDIETLLSGTNTYYLADNPAYFQWGKPVLGGGAGGGQAGASKSASLEPRRLLSEQERIATLKQLEKLLRADVYVYRPSGSSPYGYCRIEIKRRGDDVLPVLPKDMLFVQDASASITEQKLYFCRQGMARALDALGPKDRFNVVEFRDEARMCFPQWAEVTPDTLQRAYDFIAQMRSTGNTDIFGSMRELLALPRHAGRPVIMTVVSDGVATVGLTDRSLIIEAFSQENKGETSVFTLGTYPGVNAYLLDLLSYRNRGDTFVVRTGRWDIPNAIEKRALEISHPVLSDVRFRFGGQTFCEAYPTLTCNLYLDRPLVLFGRYARDAKNLVFQATGQADEIRCDMVFDIDLAGGLPGDKDIQTEWAWQKAYHLIGEHNRTRNPATLAELKQIGKTYGIKIPYRRELED